METTRTLLEEEKREFIVSARKKIRGRGQQCAYRVWQVSLWLKRETVEASRVEE